MRLVCIRSESSEDRVTRGSSSLGSSPVTPPFSWPGSRAIAGWARPSKAAWGYRAPAGALRYVDLETALADSADLQAVLLATPAEASIAIVPRLVRSLLRVLDLSGAFRLVRSEQYGVHYGFQHPAPQLLTEAAYGLTDWFGNRVREARLVANPGCYATAAILALAPLLRDDLIEPASLIIDAASGATGAGRKASEELSFSEVADDMRAYKVFRHQHTPEIAQTLSAIGGRPVGADLHGALASHSPRHPLQ